MKNKCIITTAFMAGAGILPSCLAGLVINLGTAGNFAVLGPSVSSTGAVINGGNLGVSGGSGVMGAGPTVVTPPYTTYGAGAVTSQAQSDLAGAYNTAAGLAPTQILTGTDLGGLTLTPGVYFFATSAQLTGTLTLNDEGNANAVFVFQIGSTFTTSSGSSVVTINDDGSSTSANSVFWQVGSSATLGTTSDFEGNILALASVTADSGATVDGRLLALNGTVTLDNNIIDAPAVIVPEPATLIAGVMMLLPLCRWSRRASPIRKLRPDKFGSGNLPTGGR